MHSTPSSRSATASNTEPDRLRPDPDAFFSAAGGEGGDRDSSSFQNVLAGPDRPGESYAEKDRAC